ncbi:hypothetical protein [Streptacidiphilus monticola]|uniref:Polysaccharide lyase-like protein n=1 Tax=Streptacidiphilus monticola TaxID=2161674 RepID=A0ABW1G3S4_9ACTN
MKLMQRLAAVGTAAALGLVALGGAAHADVPYQDYGKYVSLNGPHGLSVGGAWGVWTLQAKNPNAATDATDHLLFNMFGVDDPAQFQFQVRAGTTGAWHAAPVHWYQMSSNPRRFPFYLASWDFTGKALRLAPHSVRTFQVRARRLPSRRETSPFPANFTAYLTPKQGSSGQGGNFTARADESVAPWGLHTAIKGLAAKVPADGRHHQFQIRISSDNHANWHLDKASFFLWQGQKYGSMSGPRACDAELEVYDPHGHKWHRVGLGAAGVNQLTVDVAHWATGPAWNRTLTARLTLGAGFRTGSDAFLGFGYYPGSGDPDYFWTTQKIAAVHSARAPRCV